MQIRSAPGGSLLYDASGDLVLGSCGTIKLTIPASATEGFTWWAGVYDILLTDPAGDAMRFIQGNVTVCAGVTP